MAASAIVCLEYKRLECRSFLTFFFLHSHSYQSPRIPVITIITWSIFSRSVPLHLRIPAKYSFDQNIDHHLQHYHSRINIHTFTPTSVNNSHHVFELVLRPGYQECLHFPPLHIIIQYVSHQASLRLTMTLTFFQHTRPLHHRVCTRNRPAHRGATATEANHQSFTMVEVRHMTRILRAVRRMEATIPKTESMSWNRLEGNDEE
jgi:hypothetical protein